MLVHYWRQFWLFYKTFESDRSDCPNLNSCFLPPPIFFRPIDSNVTPMVSIKTQCFISKDSCRRGPTWVRILNRQRDHFSCTINLDQSMNTKTVGNSKPCHCCMCCNPANGRVDIEELFAYKIHFHGLEWNENLSADWDQWPTKNVLFPCRPRCLHHHYDASAGDRLPPLLRHLRSRGHGHGHHRRLHRLRSDLP